MNKKKSSAFARQSAGDRVLLIIAYTILGLFLVAIIFPIIYIILSSFIDPITLQNKGVTFDFSKWTLMAYERVLGNAQIWVGFKNALLYSIEATILGGVITLLAAYPMSRPDFRGRGFFNVIFVITMFFGGGLIPTYLLMVRLGFMNTFWVYIIPSLFSAYYMLLTSSYIQGLPEALFESARIDGAGEITIFGKIVLPLSTPMLACIALYAGVGHWNSWFDVSLYSKNGTWDNLQIILYRLINQANALEKLMESQTSDVALRNIRPETMRAATTVVVVLPIVMVYPFLQKYFVSGITLGAVKG